MSRYRCLVFVLVILAGLSVAPVRAQSGTGEAEEPWGYLYLFRTLRLYPLTMDEARIGRLTENQVVLTSPMVSRRHAAIRRTEDGVELVDVGSSNGSRHNGERIRARSPVELNPGDRIQLADELLLFHTSLKDLWEDELRLRLLSGIIKLNLDLPQDTVQKSLGREETVPAVTDVLLNPESGDADVEYSVRLDPHSGFPKETVAFVGNVFLRDGVLELSLWALEGTETMTSRRSSLSNLKHTTLKVSVHADAPHQPDVPWFPPSYLHGLFEVYSDEGDIGMQFATSLANQDTAVALRDAAASLRQRYRLSEDEDVLALATRSKARYVDTEIAERGLSLTRSEDQQFSAELDEAQGWLAEAMHADADEEDLAEAEEAIDRARRRLTQLRERVQSR